MADEKPTTLGRYELREILGRGAMGVVYKGYDSFLDRIVAVKTYRQDIPFPEQARKRFEREVRTASKLSHPNIVVVHDGGLEQGVPYLAMEYIEGPTLENELERRGRIPRDEALALLFEITDGLAYAHGRGVIHRDLKPANILLAPGGIPKIADFGVAKVLDAQSSTKTMTVGTPRYMAPEQIEGKGVGPASDVFSLAILAYELLTGAQPFPAESLTSQLFQILSTEPKPASEVDPTLPKAVDQVLAHALAKDPAQRTPNAQTFAEELRQACAAVGVAPPPPASQPPAAETDATAFITPLSRSFEAQAPEPSPPRGAPPWAIIVIVLVVAIGGIGAYLLFGRSGSTTGGGAVTTGTPVSNATVAPEPTASPRPNVAPAVIASPAATATEELEPTPRPPAATATPRRRATPTTRPTAMPTRTPWPTATAAPPTAVPATPVPSTPVPAPAAAPAVSDEGPAGSSVEIISEPPGADVVVDGSPRGKTPVRVRGLSAGRHSLAVRKPGFVPYDKSVTVDADSEYTVRVSLPAATTGNGFVTISSTPPGASVKLNGAPSGQTPTTLGPLAPGRYDVTVEYQGFAPQTRTIEMKAGALHDVKFRFGSQ